MRRKITKCAAVKNAVILLALIRQVLIMEHTSCLTAAKATQNQMILTKMLKVIYLTNISFTNRWSQDEKQQIKPQIEEALNHFPKLGDQTLRIGRTQAAKGQFVKEKEHGHDIYIRLGPECGVFTIAHELHHHFTREKAMDLKTLALHPKFAERGNPSYLGSKFPMPSASQNHTNELEPKKLHEMALEAVNQNKYESVYYFEQNLANVIDKDVEDSNSE